MQWLLLSGYIFSPSLSVSVLEIWFHSRLCWRRVSLGEEGEGEEGVLVCVCIRCVHRCILVRERERERDLGGKKRQKQTQKEEEEEI